MPEKKSFTPFPLFFSRHAQTIGAAFLSFGRDLELQRRFVHLYDGEKLTLEVATPIQWLEHEPTVVMVHGLCGSYQSHYLIRIAKKLYQKQVRSVRINLRGCGSGRGYAKRLYQPDCSEDLWKALQEIRRDAPHSPLILLGFSFGGNVALKMAGERGEEAKAMIQKVIAINPPVDLYASALLLSRNKLYEYYFMRYFRAEVRFLQQYFDLPRETIPWSMGILGFDEHYLAPTSGYRSAKEYYYAMSSGRLLPTIQVPCAILFSRDDPIVDSTVLDRMGLPEHVKILCTKRGGHLGFLGIPGYRGGFYWMDNLVLEWVLTQTPQ